MKTIFFSSISLIYSNCVARIFTWINLNFLYIVNIIINIILPFSMCLNNTRVYVGLLIFVRRAMYTSRTFAEFYISANTYLGLLSHNVYLAFTCVLMCVYPYITYVGRYKPLIKMTEKACLWNKQHSIQPEAQRNQVAQIYMNSGYRVDSNEILYFYVKYLNQRKCFINIFWSNLKKMVFLKIN